MTRRPIQTGGTAFSRVRASLRSAVRCASMINAPLQRYSLGVNKSIRIIVNRGNVDLEGVVDNVEDKNVAFIRANGVPDVFSVTNNLRVAR